MFQEHVCRANGAGRKIAAAIGADAFQNAFGAVHTKRAFVGANPRVLTARRQVAVTAFTAWAKFQHR